MVSGLQYFWKEVFLFFHFCSSVYTSFSFLWMLSRFSVYCWFSATSLWCVLLLNFLCFFSLESTECFKSQIYNFYQIWRNFGHSFLFPYTYFSKIPNTHIWDHLVFFYNLLWLSSFVSVIFSLSAFTEYFLLLCLQIHQSFLLQLLICYYFIQLIFYFTHFISHLWKFWLGFFFLYFRFFPKLVHVFIYILDYREYNCSSCFNLLTIKSICNF